MCYKAATGKSLFEFIEQKETTATNSKTKRKEEKWDVPVKIEMPSETQCLFAVKMAI